MRELEGDIGQAVADVRDALHREVAALAQAEDERAVSRRRCCCRCCCCCLTVCVLP